MNLLIIFRKVILISKKEGVQCKTLFGFHTARVISGYEIKICFLYISYLYIED
jgi:hypothetical protein